MAKSFSLSVIEATIKDASRLYYEVGSPVSIPLGHKTPETLNDQIQKILLGSGVISQDAYDAMRGYSYDGDVENGAEVFDDSDYDDTDDYFAQSSLSAYVDNDIAYIESNELAVAPASDSALASDSTESLTADSPSQADTADEA